MTDAKTQSTGQPVSSYAPKRLFEGEIHSQSSLFLGLRPLLEILQEINEDQEISRVRFSDLFRNAEVAQLVYTKKAATSFPPEQQQLYFFHSDLALLFYDLIARSGSIDSYVDAYHKLISSESESLSSLIEIVNYCRNIGQRYEISKEEDEYLTGLLSRGKVRKLAEFFLEFFTQQEEEKEPAETDSGSEQQSDAAPLPTAAVPAGTASAPAASSGAEGGGETAASSRAAPGQLPFQPLTPEAQAEAAKVFLTNPDVLRETARLARITLIQWEKLHGLPEGSLQNNADFAALLNRKTLDFFGTVLPQDRFGKLLNPRELSDPKERLKLLRELQWFLLHDGATSVQLIQSLDAIAAKDPSMRQKIDAEIERAKDPQLNEESLAEAAKNPELGEIIEGVQKANPHFQNSPDQVRTEATEELWQQLQDLGLHDEKLFLAHTNLVTSIDALIELGMSVEILDDLSPEFFGILFSEDIPHNPRLIEFLKEKLWRDLRSAEGRERGDVTWNAEQLFVLKESRKYLNSNNEGVTPQQASQVFRYGILEPVRRTIEAKKQEKIPHDRGFVPGPDGTLIDVWEQRFQAYLQAEWSEFKKQSEKQVRDFANYAGYTPEAMQVVLEYSVPPPEFRYYTPMAATYPVFTQAGINPELISDYMPANAIPHPPIVNAENYTQKAERLRGISRIAQKLKRRFGRKVAEEATEKLATAAGSTLPGGPATGWLAKQLATKEGRRKLALATGGSAALLLASLGNILSSAAAALGAGIGALLGGVAGFFLGGPLGAVIGVGVGGSLGALVGKALGGGGSAISYQGPGIGAADVLGGNSAAQSAAATQTAAGAAAATATAGMAVTGTQAVLGTMGLLGGSLLFINMTIGGAFLADFPQSDLAITFSGSNAKASEYVTIEKRAFITGCPENKCENPAFPIETEYAIVIRPKGNNTITIKEITDTLKVTHSTKAWEEEGKTPPSIPNRVKTLDDFREQGLAEEYVLEPGQELAFTYTESYDENYNHAVIVNTMELRISFNNPETGASGEDNAITGQAVYIGDYSQGEGCWPMTGTITQLPGNTAADSTHSRVDAFDIGTGREEGRPVYAPFAGKACAHAEGGTSGGLSCVYGNHILLTADRGGTFALAHFRQMVIPAGTCVEVEAGDLMGYAGNTGCLVGMGIHLHLELRGSAPRPMPTELSLLMENGAAVAEGTPVRSCYDL